MFCGFQAIFCEIHHFASIIPKVKQCVPISCFLIALLLMIHASPSIHCRLEVDSLELQFQCMQVLIGFTFERIFTSSSHGFQVIIYVVLQDHLFG